MSIIKIELSQKAFETALVFFVGFNSLHLLFYLCKSRAGRQKERRQSLQANAQAEGKSVKSLEKSFPSGRCENKEEALLRGIKMQKFHSKELV